MPIKGGAGTKAVGAAKVASERGEGKQELSESEVSASDNNSGMLATVRAERVAVSIDGEREGSTWWISE
jgi:hypothetical protein